MLINIQNSSDLKKQESKFKDKIYLVDTCFLIDWKTNSRDKKFNCFIEDSLKGSVLILNIKENQPKILQDL